MKTIFSRTVVGLLCLFGFCMVQTASAAQEPDGRSPGAGPTVGSGPYRAIMEMDPGLPGHTIYRPDDLSALDGTSSHRFLQRFLHTGILLSPSVQ